MMTGAILNAIGILLGGLLGLTMARQFSTPLQRALSGMMGVVTVIIGLRLTWLGLNGGAFQIYKGLVIAILALILGKIAGRALHIQSSLNRLGKFATHRFATTKANDPNRLNDGFLLCALLFCAGPLGPIGAVEDGLKGYWQPLAIKMVMDGLAAMGFVTIFGWGVVLSAVPVLAYEGSITVIVKRLEPILQAHQLADSISTVGGLLVFCVALIVLQIKKIELADYLPSLLLAPLITWVWH